MSYNTSQPNAGLAPFVPPGAQEKTREQAIAAAEQALRQANAEAQLQLQRKRLDAVLASRRELFFTPLGLRGLFPTNLVTVRIKKKPSQPSQVAIETPEALLQAKAEESATKQEN